MHLLADMRSVIFAACCRLSTFLLRVARQRVFYSLVYFHTFENKASKSSVCSFSYEDKLVIAASEPGFQCFIYCFRFL
jgi:hypothetical protein